MTTLFHLWFGLSGWMSAPALAGDDFRANAEGNLMQITSPYGTKLYFGDSGFADLKSFRMEIPIRDLRDSEGGRGGPSGGQGGGGSAPRSSAASAREINDDDDLILEANSLYQKARFPEAMKFIDELLRRNPEHARGWVMRGSLMHAMGQTDLAKKAWQHALTLDPNNAQLKKILTGAQP